MKKVFLAIFFVLAGIVTSCGVSINDEEVASVKNPFDDTTYCIQCNMKFTFTTSIDQRTSEEYWKYLEIENREDRLARVWIALENGGYVLKDAYVWANDMDWKKQIYVEMDEIIYIHIERQNIDSGEWEQCGDDQAYKLD